MGEDSESPMRLAVGQSAANAMQMVIKVYLGWANTVLREEREEATCLADFQDGRLLCLLADILTKSSLSPKWPHNSQHSPEEAKEVIEGLFDYLRCEGAEVDVASEEVMRAEETSILDILWLLMLHFCICDCELEPEEKCLAYGKLWLLDWVVELMPSVGINPEKDELQMVFMNNHNLANLIDKVCPDSASRSKPEKPLLNLTYALMFAEDRLNMSQNIVKANEVIEGLCPDYALVIYLALLKRKYDILNHSDSSSSQFGRRNNLFSDKEIIMEERSKEENLEAAEKSNNLDEFDMDDERDRTGNLELRSKSFHDESSERQISLLQDQSHLEEKTAAENDNDDFVLVETEDVEQQNNERVDLGGQTESGDLGGSVTTKIQTPERTEHSERMLAKGSLESMSGANRSFEPFSDSVAVDLQTEVEATGNRMSDRRPSLSDVGEDEVMVASNLANRDLESAPVEVTVPSHTAGMTFRMPENITSMSEKPAPTSFSTKVESERETVPFSSYDIASPSKHSELNFRAQVITNAELTNISSNRAIDTSDEDIGTLHSEAAGNKVTEVSNPVKSSAPKKKPAIEKNLEEFTHESAETIGPAGLSEEKDTKSRGNAQKLSTNALGSDNLMLNRSDVVTSRQDVDVTTSESKAESRPSDLKLSEKEPPKLKRSVSPTPIKEQGTPTRRTHSKTTAVTKDVESPNENESVARKQGSGRHDASAKSSRRGSFDSFSSESMPPMPAQQDHEPYVYGGSVNLSFTRESAHGTPVHMIGVRASPTNDPLYQLLDKISKKSENFKLASQEANESENISRLQALNGIVSNLETQIEILGTENERLKSEIQRINIAKAAIPNYDEQSVSLNAQVQFLESELEKYKSENDRLRIQMDELRRNFEKQDQVLRQKFKTKGQTSGSKVFSQLDPLMEGSQESLDRSFNSSRRTPKVSAAEDPILAKEAEIARLSVELEEVIQTNDEVVEELERVKALFTCSQIEDLKENLDREIEKAKRGESQHPRQTLEEISMTIQRLEESVASQSTSYRNKPVGLTTRQDAESESLENISARMKRKLNSEGSPSVYRGRVEELQSGESGGFEKVPERDMVAEKPSSFRTLESGASSVGYQNMSIQKERPHSGPPHGSKSPQSSIVRPVPQLKSSSSIQNSELCRSAASLPVAFSSGNSPTRTLSGESLKNNTQLFDAQVQTNLSVSIQYEPSKMSMSTQTIDKVPENRRHNTGFDAPYPYGHDMLGKLPEQTFPNASVQTNNQVEDAIEKLSYEALRSYTKNLSVDAVNGHQMPKEFPHHFIFYGEETGFDPPSLSNTDRRKMGAPSNMESKTIVSAPKSGIFFYDSNKQHATQPTYQVDCTTQTLDTGNYGDRGIRAEFLLGSAHVPEKQHVPFESSRHEHHVSRNLAPAKLDYLQSEPAFQGSSRSVDVRGVPFDFRSLVAKLVQDEVQRVKDDQARAEKLILDELALRCESYKAPQRIPQREFVPPLEELIMNRYKKDPRWKIPPSNIGELLNEYSGPGPHEKRKPFNYSFERLFKDEHSMNRSSEHIVSSPSHGIHNYSKAERNCTSAYNEHESDLFVDTSSTQTIRKFHGAEAKVSSLQRYGRSCSPHKSSVSPYEFVNSVPVKLSFKRPPVKWSSDL